MLEKRGFILENCKSLSNASGKVGGGKKKFFLRGWNLPWPRKVEVFLFATTSWNLLRDFFPPRLVSLNFEQELNDQTFEFLEFLTTRGSKQKSVRQGSISRSRQIQSWKRVYFLLPTIFERRLNLDVFERKKCGSFYWILFHKVWQLIDTSVFVVEFKMRWKIAARWASNKTIVVVNDFSVFVKVGRVNYRKNGRVSTFWLINTRS